MLLNILYKDHVTNEEGGWSGGAKVLGKLSMTVGQGSIVLAVGAGGGCLDIFSLIYLFSFLSPSLWVGWLVWVQRPFETVFQSISGRLPKRGRKRRERTDESKNVQTTPTRTYCKRSRPLPYCSWLVGCFGFNGPLRQYFSLYRAVSQREGERKEKR